jgi:hypothetical protein
VAREDASWGGRGCRMYTVLVARGVTPRPTAINTPLRPSGHFRSLRRASAPSGYTGGGLAASLYRAVCGCSYVPVRTRTDGTWPRHKSLSNPNPQLLCGSSAWPFPVPSTTRHASSTFSTWTPMSLLVPVSPCVARAQSTTQTSPSSPLRGAPLRRTRMTSRRCGR